MGIALGSCIRLLTLVFAYLVAHPQLALAQDDFAPCVNALRQAALAQGFTPGAVSAVFDDITIKPQVIKSDRAQAEFTDTFREYYDKRVTEARVERGRVLKDEQRGLLRRIAQDTGVPPHYLLAFWGLESNYGGYLGNHDIPSALATLACDPRRAKFFEQELFAVVRIVDQGDIRAPNLVGSWAGALGHTQFMPTTYLSHARDGDGDGRRDLIGSVADALTSAAHYLKALGWQRGFRWGREVGLPENFDFARAVPGQAQTLGAWRNLGVTNVFGTPVPDLELPATLLLPSGHLGPAFLVYPNFHVIMQWNRSEAYAIAVGRLADRIAGAGGLHAPPAPQGQVKFSIASLKELQQNLNDLGYPSGKPDGIVGSATRGALRAFQLDHGLIPDGFPSPSVLAQAREKARELNDRQS